MSLDDDRLTPNGLADLCEDQLTKLSLAKKKAKDAKERNSLSLRMRS